MQTLRFRALPALSLCAVLLLASPGEAQPVPQTPAPAQRPQVDPDERLPFDPAVTTGTLPNGLRYYVRRNDRPENRVMMQLAVKAGSVDEEDDQQGLAHFLEHMAFNGTERFPPGELIALMEGTGARLGPHVNAYTSFDETVYMFQLPTDREDIVVKGLQALADFAGRIELDPKEIDKERGVVIEEWRGGLGAGSRLRDQQIPVLFHGSRYAERLPIGDPEVLKTFPPERLRAFYERWYRPDRMAVVIVGSIEPAKMVELIRKEFGALDTPAAPAPDRVYEVPIHEETLTKVATDPEATQSSISIVRKRPSTPDDRVRDYRRSLVHQLVFQMLNERFDELRRKPDAQFLSAGAYGGRLGATVDTFGLGAAVEEGRIREGLAALAIEANRVQQHGFGTAELDRARKRVLASYERAYAERDKTESAAFAQEYVSHFLNDEPSPGIEYEFGLVKTLLPGITAGEVAEAARRLFDDRGRVLLAVSPIKEGLEIPTEEQLLATLRKVDAVAVTAWAEAAGAAELMETRPEPGAVKETRQMPELGITIVRFDNGVEAWLKPTDFQNDQVLFSLAAPGGASLAPPELFIEATLSSAYVALAGAAGHSGLDLQRLMAGKIASANPSVSLSTHAIAGSSTPANIEPALQLLYLKFTAPRDDPDAFALLRKQLEAAYLNRERNPNMLFAEKVSEVNTSGHYIAAPPTLERLAKLDRAAMLAFYRDRFVNAADFRFFMVGAFKPDEVVPLLARYVGSLPSTGEPASRVRDVGVQFPKKVERAGVRAGTEPRAQTVISFFADPPPDEVEQTRVDAATEVLAIALRDILREELGETYGVSVGLQQLLPQRGAGRIAISFGSAPENAEGMIARIMEEVRRLQAEGPSEDLTNRARETARRQNETALRQNGYWLGRLQSAWMLDRDPRAILTRDERIQGITREAVQEMFRKYFPLDRHTIVTLQPAEAKTGAAAVPVRRPAA